DAARAAGRTGGRGLRRGPGTGRARAAGRHRRRRRAGGVRCGRWDRRGGCAHHRIRDHRGGRAETAAPMTEGSGLRNPGAAVRGVGAGALAIESLVLVLAILPLAKLGGHRSGAAVGLAVGLAVLCAVLAGLLRYRWAWYAGIVLQGLLLAGGVLNLVMAATELLVGVARGYGL